MPVSAIFTNLESGASIDNIMEWCDDRLDVEQIKAVIEFPLSAASKPLRRMCRINRCA